MTATAHTRTRPAVLRRLILAVVVVCAVSIGAAVHQSAAGAGAPGPGDPGTAAHPPATGAMDAAAADGAITEADGLLPGGVTVSAGAYAGIARLTPALLDALRHASEDAGQQGIVIHVNSGWRSAEYQDRLLQQAVAQYGSETEAARWVATAATSAHVAGEAIDIGSFDAVAWLSAHGAGYGLCQTYENESWHFELRADAISRGCPAPYADPTADPRMQG
ncbi:peptidase M15 [Microbacterium sp. B35-04]|uniref:M15 family metallopeptidase n=1 Tax=unclassified Microbacterium TaxID=2609290 RepID=UPI0013D532DB|nr:MULTISPECIES: M15 family metallopeptidase [unclassified Microbacterium]KAF2415015.1 peptidase M15 [Microbacterium sp. B35-04]KAF2419261.1 peptidase M15 [Microbacterium sp. B35-30]